MLRPSAYEKERLRHAVPMVSVSTVRAFVSEKGEGGAPVGVVLDAKDVAPGDLPGLLASAEAAELAVVSPGNRAEIRLRFFSAAGEFPVSVNGIVASFHALAAAGRFGAEDGIRRLTCETQAGILHVDAHIEDGAPAKVAVTEGKPEIIANRIMVAEVMPHVEGVDRASIEKANAPIQLLLAAGLRHVILPLVTREALAQLAVKPTLAKFLESKKAQTLHAYSITQTRPSLRVSQRGFAPPLGIAEERASGGGAGALGAYLLSNHLVTGTAPVTSVRIEQEPPTQAASALVADVHVDPVMNGFRPTKVKVSGRCIPVAAREISFSNP
jgi:trans-2,3-dihydro-3-hydroxyanthranilate isomerase